MKTWIQTCYDAIKQYKEGLFPPSQEVSRPTDRASLTAETVRALLDYSGDTGHFRWKETGKPAGGLQDKGYRIIEIGGTPYYAHRLAWLYTHGVWPEADLDHINRNRDDNRIENLRDVSRSENNRNRRSWAQKDEGNVEEK